jgi:broad specificity phosphatase PhoE
VAIYLIRHGETASNRERVVQLPETPLSERGRAQAERLAARLADAGIRRIVSSDMARAAMTAASLARSTGLEVEVDPDLRERNFGDHRGTSYAELGERGIELFSPGYEPPGGESWEVFHRRVDRAWQRATELAGCLPQSGSRGAHVALVTHGLVCHSIAARLVELPQHFAREHFGPDGPPLRFGNTAVTLLEGPNPWRIDRFACTRHLDAEHADDEAAVSGL